MNAFDPTKYRPTPVVPMSARRWPDSVIRSAPRWASVDLRDGNQALVEPMTPEQKQRLWDELVRVGFKEIEVGFPAASGPDQAFVRRLIDEGRIPADVTIQVLTQAREDLIVRTFEAIQGARRACVHLYNSTSTIQRERVFAMDREGIKAIAVRGAEWVAREAARHPETEWTFQYSPESFTQTEMEYAVEVVDAVTAVWRPTPERPCIINLPATVEVATPNRFADQVEWFCDHVARRDSIVVSVHTHNDRGGAVAAAEMALLAGADRVEGTLLGNGERTGNMDVVTLAMNLYSQGIAPGLDLSRPQEIVRVVTECTGIEVHPRHPWVGELVYTAFSGSHQDAIRKCLQRQQADEPWQVAYLPIDPRDIGRDYQAVIRVNSQSGKGGMAFVLERDFGLQLPRWVQMEMAPMVQAVAEREGGEVGSAAIRQVFEEAFVVGAPYRVLGYHLDRNGHDRIEARIDGPEGERVIHGKGEGAIGAFIDAWRQVEDRRIEVADYAEHAMGAGTDAEAAAYVAVRIDGVRYIGAARDRDIVSASLKAIVSAINRALRMASSCTNQAALRRLCTHPPLG